MRVALLLQDVVDHARAGGKQERALHNAPVVNWRGDRNDLLALVGDQHHRRVVPAGQRDAHLRVGHAVAHADLAVDRQLPPHQPRHEARPARLDALLALAAEHRHPQDRMQRAARVRAIGRSRRSGCRPRHRRARGCRLGSSPPLNRGATRSGGMDSCMAAMFSSRSRLRSPSISGSMSGLRTMRPVSFSRVALAAMAAAITSPCARRLSRFASISHA